jgi:hypothetical protein
MGQVACEPQGATSELGIPPTSLQIGPPHNSRSHPQRSVALRLRNAFILESSDLLKLILALSRPKGEAACSEGQSPPLCVLRPVWPSLLTTAAPWHPPVAPATVSSWPQLCNGTRPWIRSGPFDLEPHWSCYKTWPFLKRARPGSYSTLHPELLC